MMTEAYLTVGDLGKYYGEVVDQIGSISQVSWVLKNAKICVKQIKFALEAKNVLSNPQMPINFGLVELNKDSDVHTIHEKLMVSSNWFDTNGLGPIYAENAISVIPLHNQDIVRDMRERRGRF